jgi:polysaccharide export outer membrane protein
MVEKILVLMIAGLLGISSTALSWQGEGDATPVTTPLAKSKGTTPEAAAVSVMTLDEEEYLIGPGDVLDISVWRDEALTRSCVVRPDGIISFPLIGELPAGGKTASRLKEDMEKKLERFLPSVTLSVEVKQINSMIIYVIGKVNTPGRFVMNSNVDVLQALATAGGLNVFAKRDRIKIFRQGKKETTIYPFQYDEVVDGRHLDQNIRLKRGDVVVIP